MTTRQKVTIGAFALIIFQLSVRIWAIWNGWFYGDDFKFLSQASTEPLTLDFLFTRHQQQLMPGGILIAWLVGQGPAFSWPLAAAVIVVMQAMASVACFVMLTRLFGRRPGILIPLAVYLFCPLTLGAFMWWAASLNQIPLQIAFFLILATHVEYLRTHRLRWLAASAALLAFGMLFYVKAVVMIPILAFLSISYFARGRLDRRLWSALRQAWFLWLTYALAAAGYLFAYAQSGESPIGGARDAAYFETADRQIREALGPALVGGPWRWLDPGRQDVLANAPEFAVTIAWIVIAAVVGLTIRQHSGAWRAWLMLALYLVPTIFLTANGRASLFGPDVGLYFRYLTDVAVVACLALACASMSIIGARDPLTPRARAEDNPRGMIAVGLLLFAFGSLWSTITYAHFWQREGPVQTFVSNARSSLAPVEGVQIIDEPVADMFVLQPNAPFNRPSKILAPLKKHITPVLHGTDLQMFGTSGRLGPAIVTPGITSKPVNTDCGYLVKGKKERTVDLEHVVTHETWWMSVNYLASSSGDMRIDAGDNALTFAYEEGPHTFFLRTTGSYDAVTMKILNGDTGICVSTIAVGFVGTFN